MEILRKGGSFGSSAAGKHRVWKQLGRLVLGLIVLPLALTSVLSSQSTDGVISGTTTDGQNAAIKGASVTIRNVATGNIRSAISESDGRYRLGAVPTGTYNLEASHEGFENIVVKGIVITVGQEYIHDLQFQVGSVAQSVSVSAQESEVNTTSFEVGSAVIQQDQIDNLPIPGRQATQLALLLPATGTDTTRAQRPDANVGIGDQNVAATNYLVDGLTNMISGAGDPRDNIPQAAVQEFKVIVSQAPAEYGGRSGGVVTLVTKSGTNKFHGEAFEFYRSHYINRLDVLSQAQHDSNATEYPIQPFSRNQFGGAIGGPILRDRLHFFASYERLDDREYFTVSPGGATPAVDFYSPTQAPAFTSQQGSFRTGSLQNSYFGRIDWQINQNHTAFFKFFEQTPSIFYCLACAGGNSSNFSTGDTGVPGWTWAAGETWIISPRIVNQFGAQVAQDWQTNLPSHFYQPPANIIRNANFALNYPANLPPNTYIIPGGTTTFNFPDFKWGFYPGTQFHPFYQEAFDTITVSSHSHTFKFGFDILNQPRKTQATATPLGAWTFPHDEYFNPTDPNFDWSSLASSPLPGGGVKAKPTLFTATFPTIPYINYNLESAWYAQDQWKIRHNLTLSLGLRYDLQTKVWVNNLHASLYPSPGLPPFVKFGGHGVHDNVGPRVGFVWDPKGDGKTAIRGGYGIVYTMNSNNIYGYETTALRQVSISISNPNYPDPFNGLGYAGFLSHNAPNVAVNDNRVSNPPVYTWSLGGTRQLTSDIALIVDAVYSKMTKFQITPNVNTPEQSSPGIPISPTVRPLPAYGNISSVQSNGNFEYKALTARLDKRYSHHFEGTLSYTLAKQHDNYNNSGTWTDFYHPEEDKGWAAADRRNMLVASAYTKLPWHITVGAIYTVRSALPFYAYSGKDVNLDGAITDYVPGTSKNQHNKKSFLAEVNAWRATQTGSGGLPLAPIPAQKVTTSFYNQLDMHINKDIRFRDKYDLQLIGQLFNVLGTDNYGGVGSSQQSNATSANFGAISSALPRQQGELAARFIF